MDAAAESQPSNSVPRKKVESVVIRFAGDSGDGMQLTGDQFARAAAIMGNDLSTFPDYPAEIRAPTGTTYGVSAFQLNIGSREVMTAGDEPDVLVAMNPAALVTNLGELPHGGILVINAGAFTKGNLKKAGYEENPLGDGSLEPYQVIEVDISELTLKALEGTGLSNRDALRCKNMWALGLVLWMFGRERKPVVEWLEEKFDHPPDVGVANVKALNAGHIYGETAELPSGIVPVRVDRAELMPGLYRTITGSQAMAFGLAAGGQSAGVDIVLGSYPITPASNLLHALAGMKEYGIVTFQAEDEIAAVTSAIGASFAGSLGVTSSSGPGVALKGEALGLAVAAELPLIIVNWQRGGPSTGLPTKTEQSDLYQALYGRHGDCPMPVIAAATPNDCFNVALEAVRIATKYMTPVTILADGYIANASQPWLIPDADGLPSFPVRYETEAEGFHPFKRDPETLARVWAKPGTPGLAHRIGGIERDHDTGNISYNAANHQRMTDVRAAKVSGIAADIPEQKIEREHSAKSLAVVGWGSTHGAIESAVWRARNDGLDVCHIHVRFLNPLPRNLGDLLGGFDQVLVPELNTGQFVNLLRSTYLIPAEGLNKVNGQPFKASEIETAIRERLES